MSAVKDEFGALPDHVVALLGRALDAFRAELAVDGGGIALRSSQVRLLALTPDEGLRLTDLARRVGMTKQALGEFADNLEARGLLETVRDPADRRVRLLRPTDAGRAALAEADAAIAAAEERCRARMGARRWAQLRELLVEVGEVPGNAD